MVFYNGLRWSSSKVFLTVERSTITVKCYITHCLKPRAISGKNSLPRLIFSWLPLLLFSTTQSYDKPAYASGSFSELSTGVCNPEASAVSLWQSLYKNDWVMMIFIVMMSQSVRSIIIRLAGLTVNSFVYSSSPCPTVLHCAPLQTPLWAREMSSDITEREGRQQTGQDRLHFLSSHQAS